MPPRRSPTKAMKATKPDKLRKRFGRAATAPIRVDLTDPKWTDLRAQLSDDAVLSPEDSAAVLRWIETGKGRPPCV